MTRILYIKVEHSNWGIEVFYCVDFIEVHQEDPNKVLRRIFQQTVRLVIWGHTRKILTESERVNLSESR